LAKNSVNDRLGEVALALYAVLTRTNQITQSSPHCIALALSVNGAEGTAAASHSAPKTAQESHKRGTAAIQYLS
jgi:hypothetical protein